MRNHIAFAVLLVFLAIVPGHVGAMKSELVRTYTDNPADADPNNADGSANVLCGDDGTQRMPSSGTFHGLRGHFHHNGTGGSETGTMQWYILDEGTNTDADATLEGSWVAFAAFTGVDVLELHQDTTRVFTSFDCVYARLNTSGATVNPANPVTLYLDPIRQ